MHYRKIAWVCLFFCCISYSVCAQSDDTVSLKKLVESYHNNPRKPKDTLYVDALYDIGVAFLYNQTDKTKQYAYEALNISQSIKYDKGKAASIRLIGACEILKGNFDTAMKCLNQALFIAQKGKYDKITQKIHNNLGVLYSYTGDYDNSLSNYFQSLRLAQKMSDSMNMALSYGNIGYFYNERKQFQKALYFLRLEHGIRIALKKDDDPILYNSIGQTFLNLKKYDSALVYLQHGYKLAEAQNDLYARASILDDLGLVYTDLRNKKEAKLHFNKALTLQLSNTDEWGLMISYLGLARIAIDDQVYEEAISLAQKGFTLAKSSQTKQRIADFSEILHKSYAAKNQMKAAYEYLKLHKLYQDSLFNDEKSKEIGRLEAAHAFDEKENQRIKQQQLMEDKAHAEEMRWIWIANILFIITVILSFLAYSLNLKRKQKAAANRVLAQKNLEIENQNKQLENQNSLIKQQSDLLDESDKFKNRLFSIISHDLRAPLATLASGLDLYNKGLLDEDESKLVFTSLQRDLGFTTELLNNLLHWGRSQMNGLMLKPEKASLNKLITNNIQIVQSQAAEKQISISTSLLNSETFVWIDTNTINIVLRNLFSNAVKFCRKDDVINILVTDLNNKFFLVTVADTGIGIKKENIDKLFKRNHFSTVGTNGEKGTGLGLILCKEFVEKNGGTLSVNSVENEGASFSFTLPKA